MALRSCIVLLGLLILATCLTGLPARAAETGITIEAVDKYSCPPLQNNKANVDNFRNRMLSVGGFTAGARYTDGAVYPTDFTDPDRGGSGDDTHNFDRPGDAIAYFSGHGTCDDHTNTACTSQASCPAQSGIQQVCLRDSENPLQGRCAYGIPRKLITDQTGKSCQSVDYTSGAVAWGEDATSGGWGNAAKNGGVNFAIIDNSCGLTPGLWVAELLKTFAGASTIALIMPTTVESDAGDVADRGQAFASYYVANPNSAIGPAWANSINSVGGGGGNCQFGGGGHGIGGCGANIAISLEVDPPRVEWANWTETWQQLRDPANDSIGQGWMAWIYTCNYDCNAHGFILP
jgi:hypothetical protein